MTDIIDVTEDLPVLAHYGTPRHSGRYPWGSGDDGHQRNQSFLDYVDDLKRKGLSEVQIAEGMGIKTTELRAKRAIAKNEFKKDQQSTAVKLAEKGMSNVAIGKRMGIAESSVRALRDPSMQQKADILQTTASMLRDAVDKQNYIDIGRGVENHLGISNDKLKTAVAILEEEGYKRYYVKTTQLGTGNQTTIKVLAKPDTPYREVFDNQDKIGTIAKTSEDGGRTFTGTHAPKNLDSKRVEVRYGPDGGKDKDGVIEVRRGVDDVSLGRSNYAQVRIAVDGSHYLKGMAMYADDLPDGVDVRFNTNKNDSGNKLDAMKPMKNDPDNPFGAVIKPGGQRGVLNIVNEEGDWGKWSKSLSSQVLSKQNPTLAKRQLDLKYKSKQDEYEEIMSLTNPTVKKKLLESFADDADSAAVHLKAAALPRQSTHAILPIATMKENEIYAPNYRNGEKVVLVRYPHGGIFEIPELTVNNKQAEANRLIKNAVDAVGIHTKVAEQLSGADFDGDTVLVIPNNKRVIKTKAPLSELVGYDPGKYKLPDSAPKLAPQRKQQLMGDVSNLITDMTVQGAPYNEIARAVKHSMVVIDAEKHHYDYKQSAKDNGIPELKAKYQGSSRSGAATLISRASSKEVVPDRKLLSGKAGIDPATGRKVYQNIDQDYVNSSGKVVKGTSYTNAKGIRVNKTVNSTKMAEADDAFSLISDTATPMEYVYAEHANKLKALGNTSRKELLSTPTLSYNASSKKVYDTQVKTLKAKLNVAQRNAPLERRAQLLANAEVKAKLAADPGMDKADLKKIKGLALTKARNRVGAKKIQIDIAPDEWSAIQAGAISNNFLSNILNNTDLDKVKALATPRATILMTPTKVSRAKAMGDAGYTQAEIADALGVSTSTLNTSLQ